MSIDTAVSPFPDDIDALKALLAAALGRADEAEARAACLGSILTRGRLLP